MCKSDLYFMICKLFDAKLLQISRLGRGKPNVGNNIFRNDIHLLFVFQVLVFCPVLEPLEFDAKLEIYRLTPLVNVDDPQQSEGDVDTDALNVPFVQVAEADRGDFHVVTRTQDNQLAISLVRLIGAVGYLVTPVQSSICCALYNGHNRYNGHICLNMNVLT